MYCTETFAVGINMPVKSVCFDSVEKFDGVDFRPMQAQEYFRWLDEQEEEVSTKLVILYSCRSKPLQSRTL